MLLGGIDTGPGKHTHYETARDSCLPDVRQIASCSFRACQVKEILAKRQSFFLTIPLALVFIKQPFPCYLSNIPYLLQYHLFLFGVVLEFQAAHAQCNSLGQTFFLSGVFSSCLGYFRYCPRVYKMFSLSFFSFLFFFLPFFFFFGEKIFLEINKLQRMEKAN